MTALKRKPLWPLQAAGWPREQEELHAKATLRPGAMVMKAMPILLIGCCLFVTYGGSAAEMRQALGVSAIVRPHARLESVGGPPMVNVTHLDVVQGYVDVAQVFRLHRNGSGALLLQLRPRVGLTEQIDVVGLGAPVRLYDMGVEVEQPANTHELHLKFRLWLRADAPPGEYPLPVHLAAVAL